jgi:hypothetical protein
LGFLERMNSWISWKNFIFLVAARWRKLSYCERALEGLYGKDLKVTTSLWLVARKKMNFSNGHDMILEEEPELQNGMRSSLLPWFQSSINRGNSPG